MKTRRPTRVQLGVTAPWREVIADGVRLAYSDEGAGEPVVCLHAVGHGGRDYEGFRERMSKRFRVIVLDWPGHGRSGDDAEPPSVGHFARVLAAFLDAIGVERAILVGNSIGGGAAIRFAADFPGRARALVLENPSGLDARDLASKAAIAGMVRFYEAGAAGARWFGLAFAAYYRMVLPVAHAHVQRARIVGCGRDNAALLARAWASFDAPENDLRAFAPAISRPTLFAWATRDRFVQLRRNRDSIAQFANAILHEFDAGHAAHLERPREFEAAFSSFVASLGPAP